MGRALVKNGAKLSFRAVLFVVECPIQKAPCSTRTQALRVDRQSRLSGMLSQSRSFLSRDEPSAMGKNGRVREAHKGCQISGVSLRSLDEEPDRQSRIFITSSFDAGRKHPPEMGPPFQVEAETLFACFDCFGEVVVVNARFGQNELPGDGRS